MMMPEGHCGLGTLAAKHPSFCSKGPRTSGPPGPPRLRVRKRRGCWPVKQGPRKHPWLSAEEHPNTCFHLLTCSKPGPEPPPVGPPGWRQGQGPRATGRTPFMTAESCTHDAVQGDGAATAELGLPRSATNTGCFTSWIPKCA